MRQSKVVPTLVCILLIAIPAAADVSFSGLDTAEPSRLLFDVELEIPAFEDYRASMHADLETGSIQPLTFFPEEIAWLPALDRIQIRNRLGAFRIDPESGSIHTVDSFPSFAEGDEIPIGLLSRVTSSPDGRYLVFQRPESPGFASLILLDTESGEEHVVAEGVARKAGEEVVRFSPDGRRFIYERDASVYVFPLDRFEEDRLLAPSFRRLGRGSLSNTRWSAGGNVLFVVQGQLVHRIESTELFTRSLY
ncbi:MAG: TolB family protein, partial [Spirochaetota bacterium]